MPKLAPNFTVSAPELRGIGGSDIPREARPEGDPNNALWRIDASRQPTLALGCSKKDRAKGPALSIAGTGSASGIRRFVPPRRRWSTQLALLRDRPELRASPALGSGAGPATSVAALNRSR